jgi:hypothetical protein
VRVVRRRELAPVGAFGEVVLQGADRAELVDVLAQHWDGAGRAQLDVPHEQAARGGEGRTLWVMTGLVQRGRLGGSAVDLGLDGHPVDAVAGVGRGLGYDIALSVNVQVVLADLLQPCGRGLEVAVHLGPGEPRTCEGTHLGRSCLGISFDDPDVHRPS